MFSHHNTNESLLGYPMSSNATLQFNHHNEKRKNYSNGTWNKMRNILKKFILKSVTVRTNGTPRDSWSSTKQNKNLFEICPNFKSYLELVLLEIKCFLTTIRLNLYWNSDSPMSSNVSLQFNRHKGERKIYLNVT